MTTTSSVKELSKEELNTILNAVPALRHDFNLLITSLKRRQLSGSQQCARATLEVIRSLIGRFNFSSADQMLRAVRTVGKELCAAAPSEFSIGNLVRRVLFFIREEHVNQARESRSKEGGLKALAVESNKVSKNKRDRSNSAGSTSGMRNSEEDSSPSTPVPPSNGDRSGGVSSVFSPTSTLEALLGNMGALGGDDLSRFYPGLKGAVISAINEMSTEIDNHVAICQRAQDYVHNDECILTYGYSRLVELFLKAAATKRRFQLIVAEAAPSLEGHRLATNLSKVNNISITLIPDSNIYALMARINKVVLSPEAIMADGGSISSSGHNMVAIAAKEFSVPVVCVAAAFSLTPLFAHNQSNALQQLLSPSLVLPYAADVNFANVEVSNPAFDHLPPDLIS
eukprot:scaffold1447_cov165-Ochromonas_danica.AAC.14